MSKVMRISVYMTANQMRLRLYVDELIGGNIASCVCANEVFDEIGWDWRRKNQQGGKRMGGGQEGISAGDGL